ncbi:hypothetical protein EDB19DRAFT_1903965 [Suillus lakei]|nr:hypothetical protein EDB19DRAFT_1903965 [Suillus lakei]
MSTSDVELRSQMDQLSEPTTSPFVGGEGPYAAEFSWQSSAGSPDQSLVESPCSSNTTLIDDEALVQLLEDGQLSEASVEEFVSGVYSGRIQVPQLTKLNPNAAAYVPPSPCVRRIESGFFHPPFDTPQKWLSTIDLALLAFYRPLQHVLARRLSSFGPWTLKTLSDLAQLFCWEVLAKANMVDFGPTTALFARDVRDALATHQSEWDSSSFVFHLEKHALEHFKSFWCSLDNPNAISPQKGVTVTRWHSAYHFSNFVADLFSNDLIQAPIMHECLGILLHEMVGVEHVHAVQAMVTRAGPTLWQTADSHERRQEFTTRFVDRTASLSDHAGLTGQEESIQTVLRAGNIISLIREWQSHQSECPPPAVRSIWGSPGLIMP